MSYDDDGLVDEEQGFRVSEEDTDDDLDESMEPLEGLDENEFDDPDDRYH